MIWPFGAAAVSLRPLQAADAAAVAAIHAEGFARGWPASDVERLLLDPAVIGDGAVAGWPQALVGFALSRLAADEAEILSIGVRRKHRRRGAAAALLGRHLARLGQRGARALFLEVEEENRPALALYRRFGFAEVGRRPAYYRRPDGSAASALVMKREIG